MCSLSVSYYLSLSRSACISVLRYVTLTKTATNVSLLNYINSRDEAPSRKDRKYYNTYLHDLDELCCSLFSLLSPWVNHITSMKKRSKKKNITNEESFHSCVSNVLTQYCSSSSSSSSNSMTIPSCGECCCMSEGTLS